MRMIYMCYFYMFVRNLLKSYSRTFYVEIYIAHLFL